MLTGRLALWIFLVGLAGLKDEYHQSFRQASFDYRTLRFEEQGTSRYAKATPEGLSVEMPASEKRQPYVWIRPHFTLRGDFEITAAFRILDAPPTPKGKHTGASLDISQAQTGRGVSLAWYSKTRSQSAFRTGISTGGPDGETADQFEFYPTESRSGKLRLSRQGRSLSLAVAEDNDEAFREIRQINFGAGDIEKIRLGVDPGDSAVGIIVLWQDFTVRAERIFPFEDPKTANNRRWTFLCLTAAVLVAGLLATSIRIWHRGRISEVSGNSPPRPRAPWPVADAPRRLQPTRTVVRPTQGTVNQLTKGKG